MEMLSYTSVHQMTYLFLETAQGKLSNQTVNDSLQAYLQDLNESIETEDDAQEAVFETVVEYAEESGFGKQQTEQFISQIITCTENILGHVPAHTKSFYEEIQKEINAKLREE